MERYLATRRAAVANALITPALRAGRILDFGCGAHPLFLESTTFAEKFGIDLFPNGVPQIPGLTIEATDAENTPLPFPDGFFSVVTMLAVFEHISKPRLPFVLGEIKRVLRPGGQLIITTPTTASVVPLWIMAHTGLVSSVEIDEHKGAYSHAAVTAYLNTAGFPNSLMKKGYFEFGMNAWYAAENPGK